jgi:uncharacterized protein (DUF1800 family)
MSCGGLIRIEPPPLESQPAVSVEAKPGDTGSITLATLAAGALAACGGDEGDPVEAHGTVQGTGSATSLPAVFDDTSSAVARTDLLLQPTSARRRAWAAANYRVPSSAELLDYAERAYPSLFPSHQTTQAWNGITYRFYPQTGHYVGVQGTDVLLLGPATGDTLARVGSLRDFAALVFSGRSGASPQSDEDSSRFLLHAQFSASTDEIANVHALGYEGWLNDQMVRPNSESGIAWLTRMGYDAIDVNEFFFPFASNNYMVWYQMFQSPDAVRRRWALALSEVFVVSWRGIKDVLGGWDNYAMATYWDLLCAHAFGNYRQLLEALTLNAAMGVFLSTKGNQREDLETGRMPDENYAREVMQLFSIGLYELNMDGSLRLDPRGRPIETYGAEDVSQLARVFTGWNLDLADGFFINPNPPHSRVFHKGAVLRPMVLNPQLHAPQAKSFLGVTIAAGTSGSDSLRIALDTLAHHPNTAPFLARQFIQRLVTSDPSPGYIERVASAFVDNGAGVRGDLGAVLRAVLLDDEARGTASLDSTTFGKLREPMIRVAQWGRTFKLRSLLGRWKAAWGPDDPSRELGQYPLDPPSVFSYFRPGYVPPGTELAVRGATAPEFQIVNESTVSTWANWQVAHLMRGIYVAVPDMPGMKVPSAPSGHDIVPDYSVEMALATDAQALVRRLNLLLCAGQLSIETQDAIVVALQHAGLTESANEEARRLHVARAIAFVLCDPDYLVQR